MVRQLVMPGLTRRRRRQRSAPDGAAGGSFVRRTIRCLTRLSGQLTCEAEDDWELVEGRAKPAPSHCLTSLGLPKLLFVAMAPSGSSSRRWLRTGLALIRFWASSHLLKSSLVCAPLPTTDLARGSGGGAIMAEADLADTKSATLGGSNLSGDNFPVERQSEPVFSRDDSRTLQPPAVPSADASPSNPASANANAPALSLIPHAPPSWQALGEGPESIVASPFNTHPAQPYSAPLGFSAQDSLYTELYPGYFPEHLYPKLYESGVLTTVTPVLVPQVSYFLAHHVEHRPAWRETELIHHETPLQYPPPVPVPHSEPRQAGPPGNGELSFSPSGSTWRTRLSDARGKNVQRWRSNGEFKRTHDVRPVTWKRPKVNFASKRPIKAALESKNSGPFAQLLDDSGQSTVAARGSLENNLDIKKKLNKTRWKVRQPAGSSTLPVGTTLTLDNKGHESVVNNLPSADSAQTHDKNKGQDPDPLKVPHAQAFTPGSDLSSAKDPKSESSQPSSTQAPSLSSNAAPTAEHGILHVETVSDTKQPTRDTQAHLELGPHRISHPGEVGYAPERQVVEANRISSSSAPEEATSEIHPVRPGDLVGSASPKPSNHAVKIIPAADVKPEGSPADNGLAADKSNIFTSEVEGSVIPFGSSVGGDHGSLSLSKQASQSIQDPPITAFHLADHTSDPSTPSSSANTPVMEPMENLQKDLIGSAEKVFNSHQYHHDEKEIIQPNDDFAKHDQARNLPTHDLAREKEPPLHESSTGDSVSRLPWPPTLQDYISSAPRRMKLEGQKKRKGKNKLPPNDSLHMKLAIEKPRQDIPQPVERLSMSLDAALNDQKKSTSLQNSIDGQEVSRPQDNVATRGSVSLQSKEGIGKDHTSKKLPSVAPEPDFRKSFSSEETKNKLAVAVPRPQSLKALESKQGSLSQKKAKITSTRSSASAWANPMEKSDLIAIHASKPVSPLIRSAVARKGSLPSGQPRIPPLELPNAPPSEVATGEQLTREEKRPALSKPAFGTTSQLGKIVKTMRHRPAKRAGKDQTQKENEEGRTAREVSEAAKAVRNQSVKQAQKGPKEAAADEGTPEEATLSLPHPEMPNASREADNGNSPSLTSPASSHLIDMEQAESKARKEKVNMDMKTAPPPLDASSPRGSPRGLSSEALPPELLERFLVPSLDEAFETEIGLNNAVPGQKRAEPRWKSQVKAEISRTTSDGSNRPGSYNRRATCWLRLRQAMERSTDAAVHHLHPLGPLLSELKTFWIEDPLNYLEAENWLGTVYGVHQVGIVRRQILYHTIIQRWKHFRRIWLDQGALKSSQVFEMDRTFGFTGGLSAMAEQSYPRSFKCSLQLRALLNKVLGAQEAQKRLDFIDYLSKRPSFLPNFHHDVLYAGEFAMNVDIMTVFRLCEALQFGSSIIVAGRGGIPLERAYITVLQTFTRGTALALWPNLPEGTFFMWQGQHRLISKLYAFQDLIEANESSILTKLLADERSRQMVEDLVGESLENPRWWSLGDLITWCYMGLQPQMMIEVGKQIKDEGLDQLRRGKEVPGVFDNPAFWERIKPPVKHFQRGAVEKWFSTELDVDLRKLSTMDEIPPSWIRQYKDKITQLVLPHYRSVRQLVWQGPNRIKYP